MRTMLSHLAASTLGTLSRWSLGVALVASSVGVAGCSSAGDAAQTGSSDALSNNPAFSFKTHGEGNTQTAYDASLTNAYWLAYTSFEIYAQGGATEVQASVRQVPGLDPIVFQWFKDPETDATAFYLRTPEVAILTYKGTDFKDARQYLILADVGLEDAGGGKANSGFVEGFHHLWNDDGQQIRSFVLADLAKSEVPLYVTGHSLGGAFATLTAAEIVRDSAFATQDGRSRCAGVYTFGSPRVGDATFSDDLSVRATSQGVKFFRFVDEKDPVPAVLPAFPWSHPGTKVSSIFKLTADSFTTHEEQDLVWLDDDGSVYYSGDAEVRKQSAWHDSLPVFADHNAYFAKLAPHQ